MLYKQRNDGLGEVMNQKKKIISWILLLAWMSFIFYMSQQNGQESSSQSGIVIKILSNIGISFTEESKNLITFIIRKGAHMTEYFILYILLFNVVSNYFNSRKTIRISLYILILYAASDEIHQYFIPGRSASFKDVIIDTCGGTIGLIANNYYRKVKNKE